MQVRIASGRRLSGLCQFAVAERHELREGAYAVEPDGRNGGQGNVLELGSGSVSFTWDGRSFELRRQRSGAPVTARHSDQEAVVFEEGLLTCDASQHAVDLLDAVDGWLENRESDRLEVRRWCPGEDFWRCEETVVPRPLETVILDRRLRDDLVEDLDDFVSDETRRWYRAHAIPFRRGYLFHGPPGTGKTSLVLAIASRLRARIHRVNLVAPRLCDDSLQASMARVRPGGVVVFEDIDSLFGVHREKNETCNVTFSGLLNAIDGIGDTTKGTLFLFTTNHIEKLDAALRRKGRIDREFHLGPCSHDQAREMFLAFYPGDEAHASQFAQRLARHTGVTTAQLQEHFVRMRTKDARLAATLFEPPASCQSSMWT